MGKKAKKRAKRAAGPEAPVLYVERVWVAPDEGGERFLMWLDGRDAAAGAVRGPGVLWVRRCRLEQTDGRGWRGHLLIYGLESRQALDGFLDMPARARERTGREAFADVHRVAEPPCHGMVELALAGDPAGDGCDDNGGQAEEAVAAVARRLSERERRKLAARAGYGLSGGNQPRSPCIGVCERDKRTGLCRGCLRTKKEVKRWPELDEDARREVLRRIDGRLGLAAAV